LELTFEDKLLISRAEDLLERAGERHMLCATVFLSPAEQTLIERTLPRRADVAYTFWGGYNEAERAMFVCYPEYKEFEPEEAPIAVIKITGRDITRLTHRDFLGSVLALGIKRDVVGDILIGSGESLLFATSEIAEYICENLTKIGNAGVVLELSSINAA